MSMSLVGYVPQSLRKASRNAAVVTPGGIVIGTTIALSALLAGVIVPTAVEIGVQSANAETAIVADTAASFVQEPEAVMRMIPGSGLLIVKLPPVMNGSPRS